MFHSSKHECSHYTFQVFAISSHHGILLSLPRLHGTHHLTFKIINTAKKQLSITAVICIMVIYNYGYEKLLFTRAVARALIGGGGGIFIYSCSARLISFEINLKTTDFKRNSSGITRIYEYTPPPY